MKEKKKFLNEVVKSKGFPKTHSSLLFRAGGKKKQNASDRANALKLLLCLPTQTKNSVTYKPGSSQNDLQQVDKYSGDRKADYILL